MEPKLSSKNVLVQLDNFPKAAQFVNAVLSQKHRVICYGGSIRSGKTFSAIASLILLHKAFPGSRSIIVRENLDVLRKNTLPSCQKAIPSNFVKQFKGDPQFEWTFTNGSKMFFFAEGYEKDKGYDRWNGLEVNFILLEQIEELQLMALEKSLERIGSHVIPNATQPQPQLLMTVNPTKTWAKELIYDKWILGELPDKWLYIPALITDNPFIPESFKESLQELKRINPVKYQRYVEGDWEVQDVIEGAFWKSFSYELHVKALKIDLNLPLHISFDENVNPYPALSIWQVDGKDARQLHEICLRHPENKLIKVAKEFVRWARSQNWNNLVYIYGDATSQKEDAKLQAGYNYFTMLKNEIEPHFHCQIRKPSKNPPVALSADFINSIFENNYDEITILIHEGCNESIKDYTTVQEAADGTMIKKKVNGVELLGHCFIGDTLIITSKGNKKIKNIKASDYILTRKGYKKVLRCGLTRKNALVKTYNICGNEITCTLDHKIFTLNRGFIQVSKLIITDTFCIFDEWKQKQYITMAKSLSGRLKANALIKFTMLAGLMEVLKRFICIDIYGNKKGAKYLKDTTYTTKTKIPITTLLITWNVLQLKSIGQGIKEIIGITRQKAKNTFSKYRNLLRIGIDRQKVGRGIANMLKRLLPIEKWKNIFVRSVEMNILPSKKRIIGFAPIIVQAHTGDEAVLIMSKENVLSVKIPLQSINTQKSSHVQGFAVKNSEQYADVYDLTVEGQPEFYANNILVHNCSDNMRYFLAEVFKDSFRKYQRGTSVLDYTLAPVKQKTY